MNIEEIIEQPHPALKKVLINCDKQIENSNWHVAQPLSDHLLKTKEEVKKIIDTLGENYLAYLNQKIEQNTKKDLLKLVGLLHDIGKNVIGIKNETSEIYDPFKIGNMLKKTSYIGHEMAGGIAVKPILDEVGFSKAEIHYVCQFITEHDFVHQAVEAIYNGKGRTATINQCKHKVGSLYPELLVQTLADMRAGTLDQTSKEEFNFREKLLLDLIQEQEQSGF